jgi:hypothetical protein
MNNTRLKIYRLSLQDGPTEVISFETAVIELSKYYSPDYAYRQLQTGYLIYTDQHCYWTPSGLLHLLSGSVTNLTPNE